MDILGHVPLSVDVIKSAMNALTRSPVLRNFIADAFPGNVIHWKRRTSDLMEKISTSHRSIYSNCIAKRMQKDIQNIERPRAQTTIDEEEIQKFSAQAQLWWDESGEFEALHTMNELRVPLIVNALKEQKLQNEKSLQNNMCSPLDSCKILDVGSGGGILSEPLGRLGAFVIGVDASEENIKIAQAHVIQNERLSQNIKYICATVEDMVETEERSFDAVVASEVVEHVLETPLFIKACCKLVKPGGSLFLTTLNKTYLSYVLGVLAAERLLGLVAPGTHDWNKFISPQDLQYLLDQNGFTTRLVHGMMYNPITKRWAWTSNTSINYAVHTVCTDEALNKD